MHAFGHPIEEFIEVLRPFPAVRSGELAPDLTDLKAA